MEMTPGFKKQNVMPDYDFMFWNEEAGLFYKVRLPVVGTFKEDDFFF